jgi:hypothetical protein
MRQRPRRTASATVAALALVLTAAACSGDHDEAAPAPSSDAGASATAPSEVASDVAVGVVEGRLPASRREELVAEVQPVVDAWIDGAFLGGDYPRSDFTAAWADFTPGARHRAERDADLMSNSDIGARIDGVEPERRQVRLDVLSVRQRPVGVTARGVVRFGTTGSAAQDVRVAGRLYLTKGEQGWQVFGYDMTKGTV